MPKTKQTKKKTKKQRPHWSRKNENDDVGESSSNPFTLSFILRRGGGSNWEARVNSHETHTIITLPETVVSRCQPYTHTQLRFNKNYYMFLFTFRSGEMPLFYDHIFAEVSICPPTNCYWKCEMIVLSRICWKFDASKKWTNHFLLKWWLVSWCWVPGDRICKTTPAKKHPRPTPWKWSRDLFSYLWFA